jgi:Dolichyl-phosphate-mannose-protein mannosyltransferase
MRASVAVLAVVTVLIGATVAARVPLAAHEPLWLDETVSARIISEPTLGSAIHAVRRTESSPPGWHILNLGLRYATGLSMEHLRYLSVLFSIVLTALVVAYGLALGLPLWGAALAGALVALGTNFVAHGSELRPYALLTLLAVVFALALQRAVDEPTRRRLGVLAVVVAAGVLTHYFFLFSVGVGALWIFVAAPRRDRVRVLAAIAVGLVPLVPWLPSFAYQYHHDLYAYTGPFEARTVVYSYARIVGVLSEHGALFALARLAVALLVLFGVVALLRRRRDDATLVAAMAIVPVVLTAVLWELGPRIFNERNLLVSGPFAALAIATAVAAMPRGAAAVVSLALLAALGVSLWRFEVDDGRASYNGIAQALVTEGWQPGDVVAQFGPAPLGLIRPVGWYLPGRPTLVHDARPGCAARVFVVSYDATDGPTWLRTHRSAIVARREFTAYDHTPRGPRTQPAIVVASLRAPAAGLTAGLVAQGARLYTAARC